MTVYLSDGLYLNISFNSNDMPLIVGKIDKNTDLSVLLAEYLHLDSWNIFTRNSAT